MIETFVSRSGAKSLRIDGTAFHSSYDPRKEARAFIEANLSGEDPAVVLLLGEGLGYASAALKERLPHARILSVFHSAPLHALAGDSGDACWHPGCGIDLPSFLRRHLTELDVEGLKVLEWPVSARVFPEESLRTGSQVRETVRELAGNVVTTAGFGRRWLRNSLINWIRLETVLSGSPCRKDRPVLVAASGPTLARSLPAIRDVRDRIDLWALPSAVEVLAHNGLRPDLVVMTDAGHWSAVHLHHAVRGLTVAMPLSAATGTWAPAARTFLLQQPTFFERGILSAAGLRPPQIPPQGTVTATALLLALRSTEREVILAGLDLCILDLESHARPNAFDTLLRRDDYRLSPHSDRCFRRAMDQAPRGRRLPEGMVRFPPPLRAYADWFSRLGPVASRIHRMYPSAVALPSLHAMDDAGLRRLAMQRPATDAGPDFHDDPDYPSTERRVRIASDLIGQWSRSLHELRDLAVRDADSIQFDGPTAEISYFLDPRGVLELRRTLRRSGSSGASRIAASCLSGGIDFLDSLQERYLGHAVPA